MCPPGVSSGLGWLHTCPPPAAGPPAAPPADSVSHLINKTNTGAEAGTVHTAAVAEDRAESHRQLPPHAL